MARAKTIRPAVGRAAHRWWRLLGEIPLLAALFAAYLWGRHLAAENIDHAVANASSVWKWERAVSLPDESMLQMWLLGWTPAARLANLYYLGAHFSGIVLVLAWLFCRHPPDYVRVRAELVLVTAAALIVHILIPLAPPRLMPELGMVDTMTAVGPSAYSSGAGSIANQYAAMPSLHVGWALLVAVAVIRAGRGRARLLVLAHPALTVAVVIVTANHYWTDGLVAAVLLAAAILGVTAWHRGGRRRPGGTSPRRRLAAAGTKVLRGTTVNAMASPEPAEGRRSGCRAHQVGQGARTGVIGLASETDAGFRPGRPSSDHRRAPGPRPSTRAGGRRLCDAGTCRRGATASCATCSAA